MLGTYSRFCQEFNVAALLQGDDGLLEGIKSEKVSLHNTIFSQSCSHDGCQEYKGVSVIQSS